MGDEWKAALAFVVYALVWATIAAFMAKRKGRSVGLWFTLGVVLGILAPIILGCLDNAGIRWVRKR